MRHSIKLLWVVFIIAIVCAIYNYKKGTIQVSNNNSVKKVTAIKITTNNKTPKKTETEKSLSVPVGEENFNKLVNFIEKNGFVVYQRGIPSDHQYTFFDKSGNRHAMIIGRRDKNFNPSLSLTDPINVINVWAHYKGIRDFKHSFCYDISKKEAHTFTSDAEYARQNMPAIKNGYEEFLAKVNAEQK